MRELNNAWIQEVQENLQLYQHLASLTDTTQQCTRQHVSCSQMAVAASLVTRRLTLQHGQWWLPAMLRRKGSPGRMREPRFGLNCVPPLARSDLHLPVEWQSLCGLIVRRGERYTCVATWRKGIALTSECAKSHAIDPVVRKVDAQVFLQT